MRFMANQYEFGYINELKELMKEISETITCINEATDTLVIPNEVTANGDEVVYDTAAADKTVASDTTTNTIEDADPTIDETVTSISSMAKSLVAKQNRAEKLVKMLFDPDYNNNNRTYNNNRRPNNNRYNNH